MNTDKQFVIESAAAPRFRYDFECRDKDGNLKWRDSSRTL